MLIVWSYFRPELLKLFELKKEGNTRMSSAFRAAIAIETSRWGISFMRIVRGSLFHTSCMEIIHTKVSIILFINYNWCLSIKVQLTATFTWVLMVYARSGYRKRSIFNSLFCILQKYFKLRQRIEKYLFYGKKLTVFERFVSSKSRILLQ